MCQIDVCTCTRLFETIPGVQPPSRDRPLPFLRPTTPVASCALPRGTATILTMPYQPLPTRSTTDHPHRPSRPPSRPSLSLRERGVTASTTHTTTTYSFHPSCAPVSLSLTSLSFSFCFVFLKRPIQSTRRVPYIRHGAVSTGTPARSLKENAIIRRTSTNELIVGASCYRQYWQVLYSTSPGATRL